MSDNSGLSSILLNPLQGQDARFVPPLAAKTPAFDVRKLEEPTYWVCTALHHKMNRTDGKVLPFRNGFLETTDYWDAKYLHDECMQDNPFLRPATGEEIRTWKMTTNPEKQMTEELTPQIEEQVRGRLEHDLHAALVAKMNDLGLTDEQKSKLTEGLAPQKFPEVTDQERIEGVSALDRLKARATVQTGTASISEGTRLGGIVGTDQLPNAAGSTSS